MRWESKLLWTASILMHLLMFSMEFLSLTELIINIPILVRKEDILNGTQCYLISLSTKSFASSYQIWPSLWKSTILMATDSML
jgi:hypothetical protein